MICTFTLKSYDHFVLDKNTTGQIIFIEMVARLKSFLENRRQQIIKKSEHFQKK